MSDSKRGLILLGAIFTLLAGMAIVHFLPPLTWLGVIVVCIACLLLFLFGGQIGVFAAIRYIQEQKSKKWPP